MSSPQTPVVVPFHPAPARVVVPLFARSHPSVPAAVSLEQRESFRRGLELARRIEATRKPLVEWHDAPARTGRVTTLLLLVVIAGVAVLRAFA